MKYLWRGLVNYETALQDQLMFLNTEGEEIWGLEHPRVITLGLRAEAQGEVHVDFLNSYKTIRVERGGKATLHNEGQLVIYPQITIAKYGFGVRTYVDALISVTQQLLHELNVEVVTNPEEVGLFTPNGKIGAVGIRVQNGRAYHGLALNVCNNLEDFNAIRSCGLWNRPQDKLQNWGVSHSPEKIFELWIEQWNDFLKSESHLIS
jgi:lipoyl(octanoyl) transferase